MSELPTPGRNAVGSTTSRLATGTYTPHVLLAGTDAVALHDREQHLRGVGAHVVTARTGFEAIVKASCRMPDLIVLDESLGDQEVAETARLLTSCPVTAQTPVLCLRRGRRVPVKVLAGLRRQTLT